MRGSIQGRHNSPHGFLRKSAWLVFSASALLGLAACGGGGGGSDEPSSPVTDPPNVAPTVTAGADQTIQLPANTVQLTGSATDDARPANSTLIYAWSSSPAGVTFTDAAAASTTATFPAAGAYTLTLTVSDSALSGSDALDVVVQPAASGGNTPPTVTAGADQTIQLPTNSVQLTGSATDDALPANSTLTYAWSSSPAGVTFTDAAAASTTATFPADATYTLTLTVSDGALSGADALDVVVQPAASGGNVAPTVTAGADQTINLPSAATLQGSATDDGLPSTTLTYQWAVAGGATGVTIADPAAASTTASFTAAGAYELTLTVSDGALSGADSLIINVGAVGAAFYPAADTNDLDPDRGWTRVAAADVGLDQALLAQAEAYALTAGGSGMIVKGGRLVHSWGNIDDRFPSQSATKSIGGVVLGLAIDDGLVALTDLASSRLPTIGNPPVTNDSGQLAAITILQLATHTAGFEKGGGYGALLYAPGSTWWYSDGGLNWLADLLTTVFAQDLQALITARVWAPLGINNGVVNNGDDVVWRVGAAGQRPDPRPNGLEHRELASGMRINANAMARVGLLFLRDGMWSNGRILSESFVATVRTPPTEIASAANADLTNFPGATTNYGVLWWTNAQGLLPNVPRDAYWAWGQGDSLLVVIPSLDLVISRIGPIGAVAAGRVFGASNWNGDYAVLAPFLDAIAQSAAP